MAVYKKQKLDSKNASKDMSHAHELLKQDKKNAKVTIEALSGDAGSIIRVQQAEKTHRRLVKVDDKSA